MMAVPTVVKIGTVAPVNTDDEESRYSWEVHCATAAGKAKYAYCQNPEPAAPVAPVSTTAVPVTYMYMMI